MIKPLAQINIGILKAPLDHPSIADFVNNLDLVNTIAEESEGFLWRLKDEDNNATSFNPYNDDKIIVNISVWKDMDSLKKFVYHSDHLKFFQRRNEWFKSMVQPHMAMWIITDDKMPDPDEGKRRLDHLWKHGPTATAFDYKSFKQFV